MNGDPQISSLVESCRPVLHFPARTRPFKDYEKFSSNQQIALLLDGELVFALCS